MALSNEDKKDVAGAFGEKAASAVSKATRDWNSSSSPDIRAKEKSQWRNIKKSDAYKAAKKSPSYKSQALKSKTSGKWEDPGIQAMKRGVSFGDPR